MQSAQRRDCLLFVPGGSRFEEALRSRPSRKSVRSRLPLFICALFAIASCDNAGPSTTETDTINSNAAVAETSNQVADDRFDGEAPQRCLSLNFKTGLQSGFAIPPEVKFFCAENWDFKALDTIELGLVKAHIDPATVLVPAAAPADRALLRKTGKAALKETGLGPTGMRAAWIAYHFAPVLYEIREKEPATSETLTHIGERDAGALKSLAAKLDWNRCMVVGGCDGPRAVRLKDVGGIAMSAFAWTEQRQGL